MVHDYSLHYLSLFVTVPHIFCSRFGCAGSKKPESGMRFSLPRSSARPTGIPIGSSGQTQSTSTRHSISHCRSWGSITSTCITLTVPTPRFRLSIPSLRWLSWSSERSFVSLAREPGLIFCEGLERSSISDFARFRSRLFVGHTLSTRFL